MFPRKIYIHSGWPPPKLRHTSTAATTFAASRAATRRLLRSAIAKEQRRLSSSNSSCDIFAGFSFGVTVRSFGGFVGGFVVFAGAFFFGGMAAARVFRVGGWMRDGAAGGKNERRMGRDFGGKDV
jgi:hypothetical protein